MGPVETIVVVAPDRSYMSHPPASVSALTSDSFVLSNHPKAANKETRAAQVSTGGSFQAKNGRVQASLTTGPLSPGGFTCPSGQRLVLASVSYSNIVLTDTTNNVSTNLADTSRTFFQV